MSGYHIGKDKIAGILLAGGQSRRMGGGDKGLLDLCGRPMIAHVIERLAPQVGENLMINANGDPARFAPFGLPVVADTISGHVGPLAGALTGMRWAAEQPSPATHILTVSTDAPLVPVDLADRLSAALHKAQGKGVALARSDGHLHPVIGLWPVPLADDLEAALTEGVRKVLHWTDRHGTLGVDFEPAEIAGRQIDPFFNANTPEELDELRSLLDRA